MPEDRYESQVLPPQDPHDAENDAVGPKLVVAFDVAGERIDLGELHALKRGKQPLPKCLCPSCGCAVIARLGDVVAHHFAHKPQIGPDACWATRPEGQIHIAAKEALRLRLEGAIRTGSAVHALWDCTKCDTAQQTEVLRLAPGLSIVVETWGDPTRSVKPDLQVVDVTGSPLLFIEVRVTHATGAAKFAKVRAIGVPLLEVDGDWVLRQMPPGNDVPIAVEETENVTAATGVCSECIVYDAAEAAFRKRQLERESFRVAAEANVIRTMDAAPLTRAIACSHLVKFWEWRRVEEEILALVGTWNGPDLVELKLLEAKTKREFGRWRTTLATAPHCFETACRQAANEHAAHLRGKDARAAIETFGGFRTADGFKVQPPAHERLRKPTGAGWITGYPWRNLLRHFEPEALSRLVRERGWLVARDERGRVYVECAGPDGYFKERRKAIHFDRPKVATDTSRFADAVERELDRLYPLDSDLPELDR